MQNNCLKSRSIVALLTLLTATAASGQLAPEHHLVQPVKYSDSSVYFPKPVQADTIRPVTLFADREGKFVAFRFRNQTYLGRLLSYSKRYLTKECIRVTYEVDSDLGRVQFSVEGKLREEDLCYLIP